MKLDKTHLAVFLMTKGRFAKIYNEADLALLMKLERNLNYSRFREMYRLLENDGDKRLYVPTKTYALDAQEFMSSNTSLAGVNLNLPTKSGVIALADKAVCYALSERGFLYVSLQARERANYGVAGYIGADLVSGKLFTSRYVDDDPQRKAMMLVALNIVMYMGLKPDEVVQAVSGNSRYKTPGEAKEAENIRNLSDMPMTVLDRSYKKTYIIPETEVGEYIRWQWYGSTKLGTRRRETKVVSGYLKKEHKRVIGVKG